MSEEHNYVDEYNRLIGRLYSIQVDLERLTVSDDVLKHFDESIRLFEKDLDSNRILVGKTKAKRVENFGRIEKEIRTINYVYLHFF